MSETGEFEDEWVLVVELVLLDAHRQRQRQILTLQSIPGWVQIKYNKNENLKALDLDPSLELVISPRCQVR